MEKMDVLEVYAALESINLVDPSLFDRKGFGRFHPLGWNSKKPKVFNFQATN